MAIVPGPSTLQAPRCALLAALLAALVGLVALPARGAPSPRYVPVGYDDAQPFPWDGAVGLVLSGELSRDGQRLAPGAPLWVGDRLKVAEEAVILHAALPRPLHLSGPERWRVGGSGVRPRGQGRPEPVDDLPGWASRPHLPRDHGDFVAQLDELGLPRTPAALAWQERVDGGSMRAAAEAMLRARLREAREEISAAFPEITDPEDLAAVRAALPNLDLLVHAPGPRVALLSAMFAPPAPSSASALPARSPLCPQGEVLLLEVFPTSDSPGATLRRLPRTTVRALSFREPDEWRVAQYMSYVRIYSVLLADELRAAGCSVRALPVPYSNTVENIALRRGLPEDAIQNLHRMVAQASPQLSTIAIGYSQGSGAIRAAVARWQGADGLDGALVLGPMGGVDGRGGRGVWAGLVGSTRVLAVANTIDPAADIPADVNFLRLLPGMLNFPRDPGRDGTRYSNHSLWYGWKDDGADPTLGLDLALYGYPTPMLRPLFEDLVAGVWEQPFAFRGDWRYDLRELLVSPPADLSTLRLDPRQETLRYRPPLTAP